MSNATRKHVRAAIVATAATFAELREQWSVREDLADLTSRVETALADATAALQGSKPTEQVREAQLTAGTLLAELMDALTKPAADVKKVTRTRAPAKPPEVRELFRDDEAHILVNWILDPAAPRFVVVQLTVEAGAPDEELLIVKATRQWAAEKKQALEFAARKACEIKGVAYVEPEAPAAPTRKRGAVKETRTTVYGDGGPVQVVMVTGGENRYEVVVNGDVKHTIKATKNWRLERQEAIGQASQLVASA